MLRRPTVHGDERLALTSPLEHSTHRQGWIDNHNQLQIDSTIQ